MNWWQFDKDTPEERAEDEARETLTVLEKRILDTVHEIVALDREHPGLRLITTASLRKVQTAVGAQAQSLGLKSVTVKRRKVTL